MQLQWIIIDHIRCLSENRFCFSSYFSKPPCFNSSVFNNNHSCCFFFFSYVCGNKLLNLGVAVLVSLTHAYSHTHTHTHTHTHVHTLTLDMCAHTCCTCMCAHTHTHAHAQLNKHRCWTLTSSCFTYCAILQVREERGGGGGWTGETRC